MLGIPRPTIRGWLDPNQQALRLAAQERRGVRECQRCIGTETALGPDYVYLLGLYLGDGCLSRHRGGVWRLRIIQDQRYRGLINECRLAIAAVTLSRVSVIRRIGCVEIGASWQHWVHLFPQHGDGPKWRRPIIMEQWQQTLLGTYPGQLMRGLIHSDGCRSMNTVSGHGPNKQKRYRYPRYMFTNMSDDIRLLFTEACDRLRVHWTQTNARTVAVSRRKDVEFLDTFIGPKR
ncbi:MAG TPA: hypothetical protein VF155_11980 [Candidatus Dormibacteraeota bacterium]